MSAALEKVTQVAIVANLAAAGFSLLPSCTESAEMVEHGILGFFVVEVALTMRRLGWQFWRNGWHLFDLAVVALSILPMVADGTSILRAARWGVRVVKVAHVTRHAAQLRVLQLRWHATEAG